MTVPSDIRGELLYRITADLEHFGGTLPERTAIAWRGYLAAMLEWDLISVADHDALVSHLPEIADDPVVEILRGRD